MLSITHCAQVTKLNANLPDNDKDLVTLVKTLKDTDPKNYNLAAQVRFWISMNLIA